MPLEDQFGLAFVDDDKSGYPAYIDAIVPRLLTGGVILVDNTLRAGTVADAGVTDGDTAAMRRFNDTVAADPRLWSVLLPIADGLTFLQKR